MIARTDVLVDAIARLHHALAALEPLGILGPHPALADELALAVRDNHLEAALSRAHRLFQGRGHPGDPVGAHLAQPFHAHTAQRGFHVHAGSLAGAAGGTRRHELLPGRRGVAVLHDDEDAVTLVEQTAGNAGDETVVPEAAIAHHGDRTPVHVGAHGSSAGERHAVA